MPSMGACVAASSFQNLLKAGKEIPWEEIVRLDNIIGGEIRLEEREFCYQGIISEITLENGVVSIMCPWVLRTPMDDDGDPIGDFSIDGWEVAENPRPPITIHVPKTRYQNSEEIMYHTANQSYPAGNWVARASDYRLSFFAGAGTIFLMGDTGRYAGVARNLASKFGLSTQ